jgi:SAM-dependent methyltransferase
MRKAVEVERLRRYFRMLSLVVRVPDDAWVASGGFRRRQYRDYRTYLEHQASKLGWVQDTWLPEYDVRYREALRERLRHLPVVLEGAGVLCLAARLGTEVKAFIDLGAFAVGIDLNPGKANRYVVVGDFHELQYADQSVDVVFTNSLDHAFDLDRIVTEVRRVLTPGGLFIAEAMKGEETGPSPAFYESYYWSSVEELWKRIGSVGFEEVTRTGFDYPYPGEQICFRTAERTM